MSEENPSVPYGYCQCGCGRKTTIATRNDAKWGAVRGEPRRCCVGHRPKQSLLRRVASRIDIASRDECWMWTGNRSVQGYGTIRREGVTTGAHRIVAEMAYGPPAAGMEARHLCGTRLCCNPFHLAWGTRADNEADKVAHGRSNRGRVLAKISGADARDIYVRRLRGEVARDLAHEYGVSPQAVADIMAGRSWAWATEGGGA